MATVGDSSAAMDVAPGHRECGKEPLDAKARGAEKDERDSARIWSVLDDLFYVFG